MVEVEIDGIKVEVAEGSMLMDAATKAGKYVPHFCYHKKLSIAANCRMCLVEVEKAPKPLPACATPVSAGMIVRTKSEKAIAAQKSVMEFLLINHPLDCPICDQGGECQLQDIAVGYGGVSSRYKEEKRVVFHKNIGPLVSAEEMSRCIHCTRCVRFGQEIAGVMELGMVNRGEHSEILSFVGNSVDSELSGNMIDLCPVGALTSKPFRYNARTWEMARRKSISAHDSLGSNLVVQVKNDKVMRVVPFENEAINECWISDRDRFSYEGLNSEDRVTEPMIKKSGQWVTTDWQTALNAAAEGFKKARRESEDLNSIACLISPNSTFEEMALARKLMQELGSTSIDAGLRHSESLSLQGAMPWLGAKIEDFSTVSGIVVVGSDLRNDQPLLANRIRQAAKQGVPVTLIGTGLNDPYIPKATKIKATPSGLAAALDDASVKSALNVDGQTMVLVGQQVLMSPFANAVIAKAQAIAREGNASFGFLGDGANWVGAFLAGVQASSTGSKNAGQILRGASPAILVINNEPELDSVLGKQASLALHASKFVVVASPYLGRASEYADVILPIAPSTETSGTFVNIEGTAQTFKAACRPLGNSRPGWKVLRVLGNLLQFEVFEQFNKSTDVLDQFLPEDIAAVLNNSIALAESPSFDGGLELAAYASAYHTDGTVRRASSLQKTKAASASLIQASQNTLDSIHVKPGDLIELTDSKGGVLIAKAGLNNHVADQVLLVPVGREQVADLKSCFGSVQVKVCVESVNEVQA